MFSTEFMSSLSATTLASEVNFSIPITWLPVGGTMARMACGKITTRNSCDGR